MKWELVEWLPKKWKNRSVLNQIDLKDIETDSPYLAPVPFRGKRNESSYLLNVIDKLAIIYNHSQRKTILPKILKRFSVFKIEFIDFFVHLST
jgi:Tat protein secretion system quality control protein TatD with DNase activity